MTRPVTEVAKAALYRLSELGLPPTPENFGKYYYEILGTQPPAPPLLDPSAEAAKTVEIADDLGRVIDEIAHRTAAFTANLQEKNATIRSSAGDLSIAESSDSVLRTLGVILDTADAILQSSAETHEGLLVTRHTLEQIRCELQETRRLVLEDPLTGIQNRRGMEQALNREVGRSKRAGHHLSLAMLDIDFFKQVNDRFGHDAGDRALVHLVTIIKSGLRETDLLARYGGEEFVIIYPDTGIAGARFVTDRLREMLAKSPLRYEGRNIALTFSAGVVTLHPEDNAQGMLLRADAMLYQAKHAGRNCAISEKD